MDEPTVSHLKNRYSSEERGTQEPQEFSFWRPPKDSSQLELARVISENLPRVAAVLFAIYSFFTIAHYFVLDGLAQSVMMIVAGSTALVNAVLWLGWARWQVPVRWAHSVAGGLSLLVLANCSIHFLLIPEPHLTTNFLLFLLGVGVFLLSTPWFVGLSLSTWVLWLAVVANSPPSPLWGHFGLALFTLTLIVAVAHRLQIGRVTDLFAMHRRDLERRHRLEKALASAQAANLAKSQFLANMSHELRTPLNSVIGFANLLTQGRFGELGKRNQQFAERIRENGSHLLVMIDDLLDLARIEAGTLTVDRKQIVLQNLLQELMDDLREPAEAKGLKLEIDMPQGLARITTDPGRLRQIVSNLLVNAIKFTDQGRVTLTMEVENGQPRRVSVRDTGPGIPAKHLQRIFEPFEQVESGTDRAHGGAGLGLSIAQELCRALGYNLSAVSREGEGSTFSIDLGEAAESQASPRSGFLEPPAMGSVAETLVPSEIV